MIVLQFKFLRVLDIEKLAENRQFEWFRILVARFYLYQQDKRQSIWRPTDFVF